jgi:hypothetical protein
MFDFLTIGVRDLAIRIGINKRLFKNMPDGSGQVCSEMLADVLQRVYPMRTTLLSPAGLYREMLDRKLCTKI